MQGNHHHHGAETMTVADTIAHLLSITDREALLERMQAIDPDGIYTDAASDAEGCDPLELETAHAIVRDWADR
jgi:hypothetical protein